MIAFRLRRAQKLVYLDLLGWATLNCSPLIQNNFLCVGVWCHHELQKRRNCQTDHKAGSQVGHRGQRKGGQASPEGCYAPLAACRRSSSADDHHPPALSCHCPKVPLWPALWGTPRWWGCHGYDIYFSFNHEQEFMAVTYTAHAWFHQFLWGVPWQGSNAYMSWICCGSCSQQSFLFLIRYQELWLQGSLDGVHLKDGPHQWQGSLLCIWPCVLWVCLHWSESTHYGSKLCPWKEGRPLLEAHSEVGHNIWPIDMYWVCVLYVSDVGHI